MSVRTSITETIPEKSTWRYTGILKDDLGAVVPGVQLTTLTLTLYALDAARTIINGVNGTNILNTGRGTVGGSGDLAIVFLPNDNVIVNDALIEERHVALIEFSWAAGTKVGRHEVEFAVRNMSRVS